MAIWFEGEIEIGCDLQRVKRSLDNLGQVFVGVTRLMPGMTSVDLVEEGSTFVTIKTNEGTMKRTSIATRVEPDRVVVEFDEAYDAGSKVTATSHFSDEFVTSETGVTYRLVMSDVAAAGFLGFFYKNLGSSKTGNAFLAAYKSFLEDHAG